MADVPLIRKRVWEIVATLLFVDEAALPSVPSIADDDAGKRAPEQPGGFRIAATGLNAIDRRVWRGDRPEPVQSTGDLPPGFVGRHDGAAANLLAQRGGGRPRLPGRAVQRVDHATTRDGQEVLLPKQRGDLAERESELFIEDDREGDCLRAELHARRAQRVGGLQWMAALHAPLARATPTDANAKRAHDDTGDGQLVLILPRPPGVADRAAVVGTAVGQRRVVCLVDTAGPPAIGFAPICRAGFTARPAWLWHQRPAERRGLTVARASRLVQLAFDPLQFPAQPIVLTLQAIALAFDALGTFAQLVDRPQFSIGVVACRLVRHAIFMADSRKKYKYGILDSARLDRTPFRTR